MVTTPPASHPRIGARLVAACAGCAAMLGYQAGLWELAVIAGLAGIVFSLSRQHTRQLVGFAGIGIAAALGWVAAVQEFAAPCGFSSEQPATCSVASAPSVTGYLVASVSHAPDSLSR